MTKYKYHVPLQFIITVYVVIDDATLKFTFVSSDSYSSCIGHNRYCRILPIINHIAKIVASTALLSRLLTSVILLLNYTTGHCGCYHRKLIKRRNQTQITAQMK